MYYLVDKTQLPDWLKEKPFETVPDGRAIVTEFELKMCPRLTGVDTFITYRDLKAYIEAQEKAAQEAATIDTRNKGGK